MIPPRAGTGPFGVSKIHALAQVLAAVYTGLQLSRGDSHATRHRLAVVSLHHTKHKDVNGDCIVI